MSGRSSTQWLRVWGFRAAMYHVRREEARCFFGEILYTTVGDCEVSIRGVGGRSSATGYR